MPFSFSPRSFVMLEGVHPHLIELSHYALSISPVDFAIVEGVRYPDRQKRLVELGYSRTMSSKHLIQPDGFGHAIDVVAVGDLDGNGRIDAQDRAHKWDREIYTKIAGAYAMAAAKFNYHIRWGGTFKTFFDGPHFELV